MKLIKIIIALVSLSTTNAVNAAQDEGFSVTQECPDIKYHDPKLVFRDIYVLQETTLDNNHRHFFEKTRLSKGTYCATLIALYSATLPNGNWDTDSSLYKKAEAFIVKLVDKSPYSIMFEAHYNSAGTLLVRGSEQ
ncbi:hypothetical protein BPLS_P0797 [Bathymodiolus platifrons methanotrophic gill symbiont]|uniref:hypothetical protein n=1 Tax=Bathymodiolus platifrons methanotrophic gill symbiont TaxID=113268 RepID=UPI001B6888B2|nr:hypothetical protein [Bathymodiolus platifrons methanotrophic gill symbiont]GFO74242.1 hypothetical protein BPLS_P0797 [Bathymodiolus platifrons methanotrophic gill symbiont]